MEQRSELRRDRDGKHTTIVWIAATRCPTRGHTTSTFASNAGPTANATIAARTPAQYDFDGMRECTRNAHAAGSFVGMMNDERSPTIIQ